jgi:ribosomal protein L7/L12
MDQFQIIVSVILLVIIFLAFAPKLFSGKEDNQQHLSAEEKAFLYTETSDAEFEQTMPFDVTEAIRSGNKIQAIKHYRDQFGTSLKESKEAVERMAKAMKK